MADAKQYLPSRRNFLIGAGAVAGVAIGWSVWPRQRAWNLALAPGEAILNGWIKLGSDGHITVIVPQAEMGQGVYTSLPQILADELGADWRMVGVEPAPLHPLYANKILAGALTAGLPSFLQGIGGWVATEMVTRAAMQLTGGSTSVRSYFEPLRMAGAAAREMLCRAAAREWQVDWRDCDTAQGYVIHKANRLSFAALSGRVDPDDAPSEPTLRPDGRGALIGRSVPRLDVPAKVDGTARFGADVRLPDMVYASVRSGPLGATGLASANRGKAGRQPGLIATVEGPTWVAAVAQTWWAADRAVQQIAARYDHDGLADSGLVDAALIKGVRNADAELFRDEGDVDGAMQGVTPLRADYAVPFLAHACMEPMTATVRIASDGRVEVWAPTQSATLVNWAVADALGVSKQDVTVYPTLLGGGFGRKAEADACVQAAQIARQVKRPVQLVWSRAEDMMQGRYRPAARARMLGRIDAEKRIAVWDARIAVQPVGPGFMARNMGRGDGKAGPDASAIEGAVELPYAVGAIRVGHAPVDSPVPVGYWRSVGHSYTAFFNEAFVDELAAAAGLDPLTFRLRMLDDKPRHAEVLKLVASKGGMVAGQSDGRARGLALHESFGAIVGQVIEVEMDGATNLKVRKVTCVIDCGRVVNPDIVRQQMESSIIFGLTAALYGKVGFERGWADVRNFDSYPLMMLGETPEIEVLIIDSNEPPGGVGEPGVPPVAPALVNAIAAATGERIRDLPIMERLRA